MHTLTVRLDDELADAVKDTARREGCSINAWVAHALRSATDPEYAEGDAEQLRARFRRAGLLAEWEPPADPRPSPEAFAAASRAASRGTPLSQLVSEDRGPY